MRDVIQVERQGTGDASASVGELGRVADELLPPLVARLGVSDLGEIEVRQGTWRVRIRRSGSETRAATSTPAVTSATTSGTAATGTTTAAPSTGAPSAAPLAAAPPAPRRHRRTTRWPSPTPSATSRSSRALRSGIGSSRGDVLGWVDVLGVRQEIVSPADGVIGRFVTEPGDPVEYGQELVALIATSGAA